MNLMRRLPRSALFLVFLWLPVLPAVAANIDFSTLPDPLVVDQEFTLDVNLTGCAGCGNSYFRGVFYPSGTSYFGQTQNNSGQWIGSASDKTQYFAVMKAELVSGTWSGRIRFKANSDSSFYTGPGPYNFKIGRYTSATSSAVWSSTVSANLVSFTPPTPTPVPESTSTPIPDSTATPVPSPIPEPSPSPGEATPVPTPRLLRPQFPVIPAFPFHLLNRFFRFFRHAL